MKGTLKTFYTLIVFQIVLVLLFGSFAFTMAEINCPSYSQLSGLYNESTNVTQNNIWYYIGVITNSQCTGIPLWVWLLVFLPTMVSIIVYVLPNWIAGGG